MVQVQSRTPCLFDTLPELRQRSYHYTLSLRPRTIDPHSNATKLHVFTPNTAQARNGAAWLDTHPVANKPHIAVPLVIPTLPLDSARTIRVNARDRCAPIPNAFLSPSAETGR